MRSVFGLDPKALEGLAVPKELPAWLREGDYYAKEYGRTGFRGGLNWYRAQDISWQETPFLIGRKLLQPTPYIVGEDDVVVGSPAAQSTACRGSFRIFGKGGVRHWTEQEAPGEVNRLMAELLHSIDAKDAPSK